MLRRWPEAREETPPAAVQQAIDGVVALLSGAAVDLSTVPLDMERVPTFDRRVYEIAPSRRAASRPWSTRTRRSRGCNAAGSGWSTAKKVARYLLFSSPIPCFDRDGHSFVPT